MKIIKRIGLLLFFVNLFGFNTLALARLPVVVNGQVLPSLADMLERITPAVVNISAEKTIKSANVKEPVFRHFFGKEIPVEKKTNKSKGSGIIVDAYIGYIVTNAHVIDGADTIIVTLKDKRQFYAILVGKDLKSDVAVIQIRPERLIQMPIAYSKKVRVGDFVVAIGNPFGLGQTVTSGIVSALGRTDLGIKDYEDFIQTDAPINPGNSGGALVNLRGELIGVNTAILGGVKGGATGISFAIPSDMVRNISDQLIQNGFVERWLLGLAIEDLTPKLVKSLKLPNGRGAFVASVSSGLAAEKAGIKVGDVITQVNDIVVESGSNLKSILGNLRKGSKTRIEYVRNGVVNKCVAEIGAPEFRTGEELAD